MKKLAPATKYQFKIRACKQDDKKTNNNHYGKYSGVVTATTKKSDKITQADIDAMKKELQEYSNSKAEYVNTHYMEFSTYGEEFNTLEEYYDLCIREKTPNNSGYNDEYTIYFDETDIDGMVKSFKEDLDYLYKRKPKTYLVVYVEINSSYWSVYFLN